jgi:hypothetical protein
MGGRFLYGDSEPFPGGYDFLAALRQFVEASSRALLMGHEADELERSLGARAQEHLHALDSLHAFFSGVGDLIAERAARSPAPQIVGPISAHAKAARSRELDGSSVDVTSRIRDTRAEARRIIAEYLLTDPLPVLSWALSLNLAGTPPSGQVVLEHPADITTSFALHVGGTSWGHARRIGDISPGLTLQVGFKKAFLRSSLQPDIVALDELVIAGLELGPDSMEVRLRRRLDAPRDAFVLSVDPDDGTGGRAFLVRVTRFDERGTGEPFTLQGEESDRVIELSAVLRGECAALLGHKHRLLAASIDGHDVFERGLVGLLLQRIADRLAPVAFEVSRHSPNPHELSLKFEKDGGRREELYLRKADLLMMVATLPPEAQAMYSRLAFMPTGAGSSVRPPVQVAEEEPPSDVTASEDGTPRGLVARPTSAPPPPKRKW